MSARVREAIALESELARHAPLLGPRDPRQPDVWFAWCTCGWDGGRSDKGKPDVYRRHVAASLLAALDEVTRRQRQPAPEPEGEWGYVCSRFDGCRHAP